MTTIKAGLRLGVVLLGIVACSAVRAEATTYEWESTSGLLFSTSQAAIEEITGQASAAIPTPLGVRYFVEGSMHGRFTYDPELATFFQTRGIAQVYTGTMQGWSSHLVSGGATIGTFTGNGGELIVRDGDAAGQPDLVNANMCRAPWCLDASAYSVGDWQATNNSVVWTGQGFQEGFEPPLVLPPPNPPVPLAVFGFFNATTGENVTIIARGLEFREATQSVAIDVKPGSEPNCFNVNGHGVIPVAILGSPEFDVANVDQATLSFGGLSVGVRGNRYPQCGVEDVNADGYPDLVCQFEDDSNAWVEGGDEATLSGTLLDGTPIEGSDSICLVP